MGDEMKPFAWVNPNHAPSDIYPHCELVLYRNRGSENKLPLYTAEQLAAAVAAERERCAKVCKDARLNEISAPADWHNDACEDCIRAIRSDAK